MRRAITIIFIIAVIAGASWAAYGQWGGARAAKAPDYEVLTIGRGDIKATVSATGSVLAEREANLAFQGTGTVLHVNVKEGDPVRAGQVLAELDTADLELAVRLAEVSVRTAEAQLQQLQAGANDVDVAAAQAQLNSAQANYQQLLNGADQDEQAAARAQVEQARVALDQAQQAYDRVKDLPNVGMLPQAAQLQQATINYQTAQAQYRVNTRGARQAQLVSAQAQVAQAQATLDKLQRGPSKEQLEIAQAGVDQARLSVEQAQRRLASARIVAPWDGVVTAVNAVEGTAPQPALPPIQLADARQYHINVRVDEADVASIAEGQPVTIDLDAFPDHKLTGHVVRIAPAAATGTTGVVAYQVRIDIEPGDIKLRSGMSATATIISAEHTAVLLTPNRAIQIDRESGKTYVERLTAQEVPQKIEVRLGLRGDQVSEVREGLNGGDRIIIRQVSSLERLMQSGG